MSDVFYLRAIDPPMAPTDVGRGEIRSRRMFGGHGIYRDDLMFAIVADDVLYLKAEDKSEVACRTQGGVRSPSCVRSIAAHPA